MKDDPHKFVPPAAHGQSGSPGFGGGESPHSETDAYHAVFEHAPDGILLVDERGTIRDANPQALRLFGFSREELVGGEVERLVPPELREGHREHRERYALSPEPRPMGIGMELAGVRRDGSRVPVEISLSPLATPEEVLFIAVVRDLTERRRLRDFGAGAVRAAEEERRRIARELHDDTAQRLAALLVRLRVAEARMTDQEAAAGLSELRRDLHEATEGVRRIARGLRPPELDDVGLAAALRAHVRERFPDGSVDLETEGSDLDEELAPETALAAYRIAQEALSNAARHSGGHRISLRTWKEGGCFFLEVRDDGQGFDPRGVRLPGAGLGLLGMKERAGAVGGGLELDSEEGAGTRVLLRIPVSEEGVSGTPRREDPDRD